MRLTLFIVVGMLWGCQTQNDSSLILVEVDSEQLTAAEIHAHLPKGMSAQDSAAFCSAYIQQWTREQVLKMEAGKLSAPADLEIQLDRFKNQLLVQSLREKIISDRIGQSQNMKSDSTQTGLSEEVILENKKWQIWEQYQTELLKKYEAEGKIKKQ